MKKTLILTACLCGAWVGTAMAESTALNYAPSTVSGAGADILSTSAWGYFWNVKNSAASDLQFAGNPAKKGTFNENTPFDATKPEHTAGGVYEALTTTNNADYSLNISSSTVNVSSALYFDKVSIAGGSSVTLNMGSEGCITTQAETSLNALSTALTFKTETAEAAVADAVRTKGFYTRVLLESVNETIWFSNGNAGAHNTSVTLSDALLDAAGFQNLGLLYSQDGGRTLTDKTGQSVTMSGNQYALVYAGNGATYANGLAPKVIMLVATPEPATATLSLLAFAGLASRRRRH